MTRALWTSVFWIYCGLTLLFAGLSLTHWGQPKVFLIAACVCNAFANLAGYLSQRRRRK